MTSPAITKTAENQKAGDKKSPTHSGRAPSRAESASTAPPAERRCPMPIGWLRVFKMSNLMSKQSC